MRRTVVVLVALGLALLSGCRVTNVGGPELRVWARRGQPTVEFEVVGSPRTVDLYVWDFGDGEVLRTTSARVRHTYSRLDVYRVRVELVSLKPVQGGPPWLEQEEVVRVLEAVVDIRKPAAVESIFVSIVGPPPNWYDPRTWPEDHFPSSCPLQAEARFVIHEPGVRPARYTWELWREGELLLQVAEEKLLIPAELFLARGCPPEAVAYRVRLVVEFSDGGLDECRRTIYAVPAKR